MSLLGRVLLIELLSQMLVLLRHLRLRLLQLILRLRLQRLRLLLQLLQVLLHLGDLRGLRVLLRARLQLLRRGLSPALPCLALLLHRLRWVLASLRSQLRGLLGHGRRLANLLALELVAGGLLRSVLPQAEFALVDWLVDLHLSRGLLLASGSHLDLHLLLVLLHDELIVVQRVLLPVLRDLDRVSVLHAGVAHRVFSELHLLLVVLLLLESHGF